MFTLDATLAQLKSIMFAHGSSIVKDLEIWYKRVGHVNIQRVQLIEKRQLVTGLHKFTYANLGHVCDAYQFGCNVPA